MSVAPLTPVARSRAVHAALAGARTWLDAHDADVLATQIAITEIPAPTGDETARGRWLAGRLRAAGIVDVRRDTVGNVIATRPGTRPLPPVLVCAHLDTVFPVGTDLTVRREGARLRGPGIGDNGRGLAAMLAVAEVLEAVALPTTHPIAFVGTVGEEGLGDLRGVKHLFEPVDGRPVAVIALDGTGDDRVVHRALGSRRYRVTATGPGGHSWAAFGAPNPVHAIAGATARLAALPLPVTPRTTLSVGRIGGGISVNAIPLDAWIEVDVRSTAPVALERLDRELRRSVQLAVQEENARRAPGTPPLGFVVDVIGDRPCGEIPADNPLVVAAAEATRLVGREPELATASTDANVPIGLGLPAVALGAGGQGGDVHTPGEWYENARGPLGVARALTVVVTAAGIA